MKSITYLLAKTLTRSIFLRHPTEDNFSWVLNCSAGETFHGRQTYIAIVESEKVFDRVQKAIWWAMRKLVL